MENHLQTVVMAPDSLFSECCPSLLWQTIARLDSYLHPLGSDPAVQFSNDGFDTRDMHDASELQENVRETIQQASLLSKLTVRPLSSSPRHQESTMPASIPQQISDWLPRQSPPPSRRPHAHVNGLIHTICSKKEQLRQLYSPTIREVLYSLITDPCTDPLLQDLDHLDKSRPEKKLLGVCALLVLNEEFRAWKASHPTTSKIAYAELRSIRRRQVLTQAENLGILHTTYGRIEIAALLPLSFRHFRDVSSQTCKSFAEACWTNSVVVDLVDEFASPFNATLDFYRTTLQQRRKQCQSYLGCHGAVVAPELDSSVMFNNGIT